MHAYRVRASRVPDFRPQALVEEIAGSQICKLPPASIPVVLYSREIRSGNGRSTIRRARSETRARRGPRTLATDSLGDGRKGTHSVLSYAPRIYVDSSMHTRERVYLTTALRPTPPAGHSVRDGNTAAPAVVPRTRLTH